jgi:hypothetical protein
MPTGSRRRNGGNDRPALALGGRGHGSGVRWDVDGRRFVDAQTIEDLAGELSDRPAL